MKRLYKSTKNRMISGVCGGVGEYFDVDPTIIRIVVALLVIGGFGSGILVYIVASIIMKDNPGTDCNNDYYEEN